MQVIREVLPWGVSWCSCEALPSPGPAGPSQSHLERQEPPQRGEGATFSCRISVVCFSCRPLSARSQPGRAGSPRRSAQAPLPAAVCTANTSPAWAGPATALPAQLPPWRGGLPRLLWAGGATSGAVRWIWGWAGMGEIMLLPLLQAFREQNSSGSAGTPHFLAI